MLDLADALRWNRRRHGSRDAVVDERGRLTHRQLADRAWALARGLLAFGVRPGDTVGLLAGNGTFFAEAYLGILAAGGIAVPYNWRWATPELVFGINDSGARLLLVERDWTAAADAASATGDLERRPRLVVEGEAYESLLRSGGAPDVAVAADQGNVVLYTGGTTGFPKGVLLSHRAVFANAVNEIVDTKVATGDRTLLITPMFHSASLLCWFVPHLLRGGASICLRGFDEGQVAEVMVREAVTDGFLVPSMLRRLLRAGVLEGVDLSAYAAMHVGGAAFRMPDKLAVRELLPDVRLYYRYGLTEAGPMVSRLLPEDVYREDVDGSIGTEYLLTEVSIRDPLGAELPDGEVGELCVRGPNVMTGYLGRPDATVEVLRGGRLHTGDLAHRDDQGFLYFHDRAKDMIKSGGENVYSAEVEQVLYAHPAVAEAAVLGVPSAEWDEEVRAVVALKDGRAATEGELQDHVRAHLAGYKVPKRIVFLPVEQVPINPSGKVLKTELRGRPLW